nr:putative signal transduction histidine kinase [uncultured bacterium]
MRKSMRLSIRVKIVVIIVMILFFTIGANTFVSNYVFTKEYSTALQLETSVIGQSLKLQLDRLLELEIPVEDLVGFEAQCQEIVEKYEKISYAMVVDRDGEVLFHNDPSQHGNVFDDSPTFNVASGEGNVVQISSIQEEKHYDITIPVFGRDDEQIAAVRIGFPVKFVAQKTQRLIVYSIGVAGVSLILAVVFLVFVIFVWVTKPIVDLSQSATLLADGDIECDIQDLRSYDEIGTLSRAFKRLITYIREMVHVAIEISQGNLSQTIHPMSERDVLGCAFLNMSAYLNEMATVATAIATGDVHQDIQPKTEHDALGNAFQRMVTYLQDVANITEKISNKDLQVDVMPKSDQDVLNISLQRMVTTLQSMRAENEKSMAEVEQQNWLKTGQAELSNAMRGEQNPRSLAQNIIIYLANYLQVQVGTIYLADEEKILRLVGSYAYTKRKSNRNTFKFGEGLVGQAALEKHSILFTNVPEDYIAITSGLGETVPRHILVTPFLYEGEVKGVIELGTVDELMDTQQNFLEQAVENIAIAFHSARIHEKMQELLEQTQQQAGELQTQQELLRVSNKELEEQARILRESESKLQAQQEELQQTNEELEKQTRTLEHQKQELGEKNRELENARKLIEEKAKDLELSSKYKSEFLANMSHELRTPLNSLLLLAKLLHENKNGNLTEKQVEYARTIHAAGADLLELINEVLDLSKVEAGKMVLNIEEMSLKGLASYVEQNFAHVAEEKGLKLRIELTDSLPGCIRTDRQRVEQIVKNLLSNAMKFTREGEVGVYIARPAAGVVLSHSGVLPHKAIAISVSDTGIGIPEDKQRLIFEAFQQADGTTSRKYGGTGLGLSIVREFTKLLGGEIHLRSEEGNGCTFSLYLPENMPDARAEGQAIHNERDETRDERQKTSAPSSFISLSDIEERVKSVEGIRDDRHDTSPTDRFLLIIEDDPNFAKILFDLAREKGFKGLIAGDGAAGLQLAYQYIPSAILLDIALPGMDGWMVMEKLKQNPETRHIPVHFISVYAQSLKAMKMGAVGYLTKPVTLETLDEAFTTIEHAISKTIKKLLIVENDETTSQGMLELLSGADVDILTTQTGEDAYTLLKSDEFDGMVLDLGLADISGFELLERIRDDTTMSSLPVIVYTAKDLTKDEEMKLTKHAESIIIKGVKSQDRLLDEVTLFLHRVEADLPEAQQQKLRMLHDKEGVLREKTILMVDDDMRNVFALSSILEEKGMQVLIGEHGQDAMELLDQNPDIDLVLMDIMMPEMDGYEAMRQIRQQPKFKTLPIIALTAKAMKGDRQKCIDAGANDYLSKPVDTDKLLSLLRVWLY